MIRVTGGKFKGRSVDSPPRNRPVRPTTGLIRESIFNRFQYHLPGCRFLDLFAGSGIMGLEALSRGADFVLAIESDPEQCRLIRKNYLTLGLSESDAKIIAHDVQAVLKRPCNEASFDLIFMDPPYGYVHLATTIQACIEQGWIHPEGVIIVEQGLRDPDLEGFTRKNYGDTSLLIRSFD